MKINVNLGSAKGSKTFARPLILAVAASLLVLSPSFGISSAFGAEGDAELPANVVSNGGGVDVTPLGAEEVGEDKVKYSFQVSLQSMQSSDHIQTGNTFTIAMPQFVNDVKFTQLGTYDVGFDRDLANFAADAQTRKDVEVPLGIVYSTADVRWSELETLARGQRGQYVDDSNGRVGETFDGIYYPTSESTDIVDVFGSLVNAQEQEAFKESGLKDVPGAVIYAGVSEQGLSSVIQAFQPDSETREGPKSYTVYGEFAGLPMGLRVEYTISKEQAKKTPIMPLWAALSWRSFSEGGLSSAESGSQHLYEYGDLSEAYELLKHPESIKADQFDSNGLQVANVGVTAYTGKWYEIGEDLNPGVFNWVKQFGLAQNSAVTYYVAANEDYRDIAAVAYLPTPKKSPEGTVEDSPEGTVEDDQTDSSKDDSEIELKPAIPLGPSTSADTDATDVANPDKATGGDKPNGANQTGQVDKTSQSQAADTSLARTGVSVALTALASALLLAGGALLVRSRRFLQA
ncbi:hypothetical protein [Boudabousia marimammalium]|uniref:Gram-positive cocci surface proteins LPxTG domain-containing protein n=1 Tax=Boudabousia marimammalium TaxID=156892 RepID=A0A1Q5PM41_9ACTO|nr:hypothetical protein [Boudabousia marimammalium]OKL48618.1 hypothetical protein BM477_05260 [Boudabousia marimammalium]